MAYTFDEAQDLIKKAEERGEGRYVRASLVVTQHDSRTAWGLGSLYRYSDDMLGNLRHFSNPNDSFSMRFSDRNTFSGQADLVGSDIIRVTQNQYRAEFVLFNWGGVRLKVDLAPAPQGNMLIGWGNPIGYLDSQALYCLSFIEVVSVQIVLQ
jgi:hypothetical protein